jgi:hypothetical protein
VFFFCYHISKEPVTWITQSPAHACHAIPNHAMSSQALPRRYIITQARTVHFARLCATKLPAKP